MNKPEQEAIPAKKQLATSILQIGYCQYCGQGHQIETSGSCTEEQLKKWATEKCDCEMAKEDRAIRRKEETAIKNIEKMFGNHDTGAILKSAVHPLLIDAIEQVTVVIGGGKKATMKLSDKKIKIEKMTVEKQALEG